jgi:hypothetical protein
MNALALVNSVSYAAAIASRPPAPPMDVLMVCGFLTAILTLLLWMHQGRSRAAAMWLAICLAAMAVFGFLSGAWPLGFIIAAWSASAFSRWRNDRYVGSAEIWRPVFRAFVTPGPWDAGSRVARIRSELN